MDRYGKRLDEERLPAGEEARQAWAESVGQDGMFLLHALFDLQAPTWLREIPAVDVLHHVWVQNYQHSEGKLRWRSLDSIPPAALSIRSI